MRTTTIWLGGQTRNDRSATVFFFRSERGAHTKIRGKGILRSSLSYHTAPRGDIVGGGARWRGHNQPVSLRRGHQLPVDEHLCCRQ